MSAPDTQPAPGTANKTNSNIPVKRGRGKPRDPNAKTVEQIALRPADWEYAQLWAIDSYNVKDNPSTRMERMISRLRAMAPKGPDSFGYERDPDKPAKARTTPSVAREAKARGIEKAALINEMWELYKEERGKREKVSGK